MKIKTKSKEFLINLQKVWEQFINIKYIQKIFLFLPHNFFLFLLFLISFYLIITFDYNRSIPLYNFPDVADSAFDGIVEKPLTFSLENIEKERIVENGKNPDRICMRFATFGKKTNSKYKYIVYQNEEILYEEDFNSKVLEDSKYHCFYLPEATRDTIQDYRIQIAPVKTNVKNMITLFKNSETGEVDYNLAYNPPTFSIKTFFLVAFFILYFFANYQINTKKIRVEKFWILIAILFVLPITIINPPYEVPDEPIHFYNAYRLSQYDSNKNFYENLDNEYMIMPENIECIGYVNIQKKDKVTNPKEIAECFKNSTNVTKKSSYVFLEAKMGFLVSALGIKVADLLTNSPGIIFYMGRLFAALFSIFVIYKALKIAPKHKELLLLVATIPMFIQQMCSYSYDGLLNTFSILAMAILLKLIYDKEANWKMYTWLLFLCGIFIVNIKILYLPIFLFLLFVPNENFKRKIDKYIYTFGIIVGSYLLGNTCKSLWMSNDLSVILSSLFAFVTLLTCLHMILKEKCNLKKDLLILGISGIGIALTNTFYLIIPLLLLLMVPQGKFQKKWHKYVLAFGLFFLLLALGKLFIFLTFSPTIENVSNEIGSSKAVTRIMDLILHPTNAFLLAARTFRMKAIFYLRSLIGYFGWFTFHLSDLYVLAYLLFACYVWKNTEFVKTKWQDKTITILGILIGIAGVFLAMYVYWSGPELFYIDGVQGRYFIPMVAPILLLLLSSKKKKKSSNFDKNTYTFINIILLEYISLLLLFYY